MKALMVNGSARGSAGVTGRLLSALADGITAVRGKTETVHLRELSITPCRACLACMRSGTGRCGIDDGMARLYDRLRSSDLLVLGSPVYLDGMPAQLKAFIDRCVCCMRSPFIIDAAGRIRHPFAWRMPREFLLVAVCAFPEPATFDPLVHAFRAMAENFGSRALAELCVPGSVALQINRGLLEERALLMKQAGSEIAGRGAVDETLAAEINRPLFSSGEYMKIVSSYGAEVDKK